jgi:release factor glutamine methyltransferase
MFVSDNSIQALKKYFSSELAHVFSDREIKNLTKHVVVDRFQLSEGEYLLSNDIRLSESDLLYFRSIVKRLRKNEPLQYVLGQTFFFGLKLKTDARALIPRPETEELVNWVNESIKTDDLKILDLCSGSGCIALALKSIYMNSKVIGIDVSKDALELAKENAILNGLDVDFNFYDVLNDSMDDFKNFNLWVSNPPYIPRKEESQMNVNVLHHEPHLALFVDDDDPFIFYRKIGANAMVQLSQEGFLFVEIHELMYETVYELFKSQGFVNIQLRKDLQGKPRMIRAQKPKFTS